MVLYQLMLLKLLSMIIAATVLLLKVWGADGDKQERNEDVIDAYRVPPMCVESRRHVSNPVDAGELDR
jgi:hypothetical protein